MVKPVSTLSDTALKNPPDDSKGREVVLELVDGQKEEATLARSFKPWENEVEVVLTRNGKKHTYCLSEVCCIMLVGRPTPVFPSQKGGLFEEVETLTGECYHVCIIESKNYPTGFYGIPTDKESPYKLIFFSLLGVRKRSQDRPLGEILEEEGLVQHSEIEDVLKIQEKLRKRRVGEIIADHNKIPQEKIEKALKNAEKSQTLPPRARVGDILVAAGLVTREQVEMALASQEDGKKKRVGALLVDRGFITEEHLLLALANKFRMRVVNLEKIKPAPQALQALSIEIIHKLKVFPVEVRDGRLVVATSEPTDPMIGDTLRFSTNRGIELVVATSKQISQAIEMHYGKLEVSLDDLISEMSVEEITEEDPEDGSQIDESDSQIITLVNKILLDAYNQGVSDIHFEPESGKQPLQVRYRIDGMCHVAHKIPAVYKRAVLSRIKIMSRLDIAERRKPQSGKILIKNKKLKLEFRVEVTPTVGGFEDAVLRILSTSKPLPLESMSFLPENLKGFKEIISKPYGMVLCVGPTGSGKTTTLHSGLGYINTRERKIWTAEDPVEITQEGLRQVQVLPKIGLTFQEALRSFLRSDPDVIMVGEMRDLETAKTAIQASLTGHLVFSTLHTNSASETVVRLVEMGMDPFTFSDALLGVLAQRLARRLCEYCRSPYHPGAGEYKELVQAYGPEWFEKHNLPVYTKDLKLMKKEGCEKCNQSGYKGRIALHELLLCTENVKVAIKKGASVEDLKDIALQEKMTTLKMDGIQKVFQGLTDMSQVLQVCL